MAAAAAPIPEIPRVANQWVVAEVPPPGRPVVGQHLKQLQVELPAADQLEQGQVLVKIDHISVDPYQRGTMVIGKAYGVERKLNQPVMGGAAGVVVASAHPDFPLGSSVEGGFGWVDAAVVRPEEVNLRRLPADWPRSQSLGVLGMPGATAIFGVQEVLKPEAGQVVFVSTAAGAVGSLVGQICKILGCTVYGSVGSDDKAKLAKELGFDGVINYKGKDAAQLLAELKELTGGRTIDRYFDNSGGPMTDAVAAHLSRFARIAICGQIHLYNETPEKLLSGGEGVSSALFMRLLFSQATAQGFLVGQFPDWEPRLRQLHEWLVAGKLRALEDINEDGFEKVPYTWLSLYDGKNTGKLVAKV